MRTRIQCLIFVEPIPRSVSTNARRDAGSSIKGSTLKRYALLPATMEYHPIRNDLVQNGIKIIKNGRIALPESLELELLELLFDKISEEENIGAPVYLHVDQFNQDFARQLLSKSLEARVSNHFPTDRELFYATHVAENEDFNFFKRLLAAGVNLTVRHPEGGTLLHFAVDRGYDFIRLVKILLENGAEVDAKRKDGATPLHIAASKDRYQYSFEIIKMLLEGGASLNARMKDGSLPLHLAAEAGCVDVINLFLERGAKVMDVTKDGSTPLHCAARAGRLNAVTLLLDRGAKVTAVTKDGSTPLHQAVVAEALDIVKLFVEKGAKTKAKTKEGTTPLHIAAKWSSLHIIEFLIQNGADVNARDAKGTTPLILSVRLRLDAPTFLVESGADINVQNEDGETALLVAVTKGHHETCAYVLSLNPDLSVDGNRRALSVVLRSKGEKFQTLAEQMIKQGFKVGAEDTNDPNILFGAIQKNCLGVVQSLLEYGVNLNQQHTFLSLKMTPLHFAIQGNQKNIVKLLLDHGADVHSKRGRCKRTPIMDAAERASLDIVEMLVAKGVKVRDEPTLLHLAASNAHFEVVEYLLKEGFDSNDKTDRNGTPLSIAIQKGNLSAVEVMVRFGARVDFSELVGKTASNPACLKSFLQLLFTPPDPTDETIHELLSQDFDERLGPDGRSCAKKLAKHLVKVEVANQFFCARNVIPSPCYENFNLVDYQSHCRLEMESMKLEKVGYTDVTFYEILIKNVSQIAYCARNQRFVSAIESCDVKSKYAIYGGILSFKVNSGCERRKLLDIGIKALGILSPQFFALPHDLKEIVTDYLNNQDLCILCKFLPKRNSDA